MFRIAIVGAGYIGQLHANVLQGGFKNTSVVAIVDTVEDKGRKLALNTGAVYYRDFDTMLKREELDVVAICTPTFLHTDMVVKSAEAGIQIFCEKPLAHTVNDAVHMIDAVKKNNIKAMAGHVLRYWPVYVKAKEIVGNNELGKPLHCYCERLLTIPTYLENDWNMNTSLGGVALDVQIHDLDFLIWLFGKPKSVESKGVYDESYGGWLHIQSSVKFNHDIVGLVQAGWGFPTRFPFTMGFRILCENGTIEWNFRAGKLLEERDKQAGLIVYDTSGSTHTIDVDQTDPFILQWKYFLDCLENNKKIDNATFEDGKEALSLALATIKSSSEGIAVSLS